jgi:hypothetical protein
MVAISASVMACGVTGVGSLVYATIFFASIGVLVTNTGQESGVSHVFCLVLKNVLTLADYDQFVDLADHDQTRTFVDFSRVKFQVFLLTYELDSNGAAPKHQSWAATGAGWRPASGERRDHGSPSPGEAEAVESDPRAFLFCR